jgi:hypothetical protein
MESHFTILMLAKVTRYTVIIHVARLLSSSAFIC